MDDTNSLKHSRTVTRMLTIQFYYIKVQQMLMASFKFVLWTHGADTNRELSLGLNHDAGGVVLRVNVILDEQQKFTQQREMESIYFKPKNQLEKSFSFGLYLIEI